MYPEWLTRKGLLEVCPWFPLDFSLHALSLCWFCFVSTCCNKSEPPVPYILSLVSPSSRSLNLEVVLRTLTHPAFLPMADSYCPQMAAAHTGTPHALTMWFWRRCGICIITSLRIVWTMPMVEVRLGDKCSMAFSWLSLCHPCSQTQLSCHEKTLAGT